jgi:hypothetical protein
MAMEPLVWDRGNVPHLTRDKGPGKRWVTVAEVDGLWASGRVTIVPHDYWHGDGSYELQWLLIGRTPAGGPGHGGGRLLTVAAQLVEVDGVERYRPVTAWDAEGAEIAAYREDHPHD